MPRSNQKFAHLLAVALLTTIVSMPVAHADDDDDDDEGGSGHSGKPVATQTNARFQQECSACHIAYAPRMLPAESWRKVMSGLDKHFGSDASLDAADKKEITDFLVKNASTRWSAPTAPLRITDTAWFRRKHDGHEINPAIWKNPKVQSPANCAACHPQADRGNFNEHDIRIPR